MDRDTPLKFTAHHMTTFESPTQDLSQGVTVKRSKHSDPEMVGHDYFEFGMMFMLDIWPKLNGFQGTTSVRFNEIEE